MTAYKYKAIEEAVKLAQKQIENSSLPAALELRKRAEETEKLETPPIIVQVVAPTGSGGSTTAAVIEDALKSAGFNVTLGPRATLDAESVRIAFADRVYAVSKLRSVVVEVVPINRSPSPLFFQEV